MLRGTPAPGTVGWADFLERGRSRRSPRRSTRAATRSTGDDVSDILFTSGTTGRPKGAMLTHGASVRAYDAWSDVVGLRAGDRYLVVNPFFHAFGLKAGILACLIKGATIVPHAVFDVAAVMRARRRGADHDAARAADALPVDPRPPRRRRVRPVVAAAGGHRRGARSRSS